MTELSRRGVLGLAACLPIAGKQPITIILRSGWQTVNIGDIAHTPGVLRVLQRNLPEARVVLWSMSLDRGVDQMLMRAFPSLRILRDSPGPAVWSAFDEADFFLHGSGPSVVAAGHLDLWRKRTKKPYGIFGVTITSIPEAASPGMDGPLKSLLDGARFVYTRETASLRNVEAAGVRAGARAFVPDGAFSFDLRDENRASTFLAGSGLQHGKFIAVIPRLRMTPYHKIRKVDWNEAEIQRRTAINEKHAEPDHAKLREAIVAYVRQTGGKALLCPEMTYELDILGPLLYEPLPADVKKNVVKRTEYWLPDEAASTYRRAACVLSSECHSPIIAAGQGTPCIYVHQPEDGIKGQMWNDVGLGDWYLDVERASGADIAAAVLKIAAAPHAAQQKVRKAVAGARKLQNEAILAIRS
jgi:polysaccharide pyruvyl transferase WcaK-like protein